jgi:hypothetical protein
VEREVDRGTVPGKNQIKSNQIYSLAVTGPTNQKPQKPKIKTKHIKNEENQSTTAHL